MEADDTAIELGSLIRESICKHLEGITNSCAAAYDKQTLPVLTTVSHVTLPVTEAMSGSRWGPKGPVVRPPKVKR